MKKYILIAVSALLLISISVAGTVAFLTDKEESVNVFTVGKVNIEIVEDFVQDSKLVPGVNINKDVQIENLGDNDAWVWYTYAVPAALDDVDGVDNILHIDFDAQTQDWTVDAYVTENVTINGIVYNVYVCLYNSILESGDTTAVGLTNVYFDSKVDYDEDTDRYVLVDGGVVTPINYDFENSDAKIIVNAYAIQADGFDNVQDAYAAYAGQWGLTVPTNP